MKLRFESDLPFQRAAIEAVCDLFRGQEVCRTEFTVSARRDRPQRQTEVELGIGNRLDLLPEQVLENLRDVQLRNGLRPSEELGAPNFTVEMETGTGKTYVYLRTMLELNRRFGFTKFVIVVPSIAIKEGVLKSLSITRDHLRALYGNVHYTWFPYDSSKLGQVRSFASSPFVQVMVVTVGAINKKEVNNLYKSSEDLGDEKPIDLIRATRPILIVDEPQSVDGGLKGSGRAALDAMSPLCSLRYSATHVTKHHMVYRLDAVDAYQQRLVKQIEVASATIEGAHNRPYLKLIAATNRANRITAKLELDVARGAEVVREEKTVRSGDDLEQVTGRALYRDLRVEEIGCRTGGEFVRVSTIESPLRLGDSVGGVDPDAVDRQMIRRTIEEHFMKKRRLQGRGVKVLSLFFLGAVADYRVASDDGAPQKGRLARVFEEEYAKVAARHRDLLSGREPAEAAGSAHDGYFSIDKKGTWTDTADNNESHRENAARAYELIMRDKERLLSFDTPLEFIFSHSALREGWDNPNVFQICVLREIGTERQRRQTIGRGLRLCVDQGGSRLHDPEINTLTVVANESYEAFAENLQREIEADTGIRFGIVEKHQFAAIAVTNAEGKSAPLGVADSEQIWAHLRDGSFIDSKGKVQDSLKRALAEGTLPLPERFEPQRARIQEILRRVAGDLGLKNADARRIISLRKDVILGTDFQSLWDRIKHKTVYRVDFDNEALIERCADALKRAPPVNTARMSWRIANLDINKGGVDAEFVRDSAPIELTDEGVDLPDLLTYLQEVTKFTRKSLVKILVASGRLDDFKRNPQQFLEFACRAIDETKRLAIVDGIRYRRLGDLECFSQELFEVEELVGYLKNSIPTSKSVYDHTTFDSAGVEKTFAERLEANEAVKLFAKLPRSFVIPTPLGDYNPDWAVLVEKDDSERLYFVVETKGSLDPGDLREKEVGKIRCGEAHFKALAVRESPARYVPAKDFDDFARHFGHDRLR